MLSEEQKAIEMLKYLKEHNTLIGFNIEDRQKLSDSVLNLITKLQKENEQKDKQIELMGEVIFRRFTAQLVIEYGIENKEQFIEKFEKLAKEKGE